MQFVVALAQLMMEADLAVVKTPALGSQPCGDHIPGEFLWQPRALVYVVNASSWMCEDLQLEGHRQVSQQEDILDWHVTQAKAAQPGTPKTLKTFKGCSKVT